MKWIYGNGHKFEICNIFEMDIFQDDEKTKYIFNEVLLIDFTKRAHSLKMKNKKQTYSNKLETEMEQIRRWTQNNSKIKLYYCKRKLKQKKNLRKLLYNVYSILSVTRWQTRTLESKYLKRNDNL